MCDVIPRVTTGPNCKNVIPTNFESMIPMEPRDVGASRCIPMKPMAACRLISDLVIAAARKTQKHVGGCYEIVNAPVAVVAIGIPNRRGWPAAARLARGRCEDFE